MDRGSYIAASGGNFQMWKMEITNNNLANSNTPGFKKQVLIGEQRTFDQTLASQLAQGDPYARSDHEQAPDVTNVKSYIDFSQGSIQSTNNPLDVALKNPNDFFVIDTPEGQQYTRAGNFTLNDTGRLVTKDGMSVMGDGGPITINGTNISISNSGNIKVDTNLAGRLQVVRFSDTSGLSSAGGTRFKSDGSIAPQSLDIPDLQSGALEMSNVSIIQGMIELITANRAFAQYSKSSQTLDEMNQSAIRDLGTRQ